VLFGYSFAASLVRTVRVLLISCPRALGGAAARVLAVSTSIAAKHGVLIRNRANVDRARCLNAVVCDITGTLTEGAFGVADIVPAEDFAEKEVLQWAASVEQHSEHPIAAGIVKSAQEKGVALKETADFESLTGKGIQGVVNGRK